MSQFIIESDVVIRAVDKPFPQRQVLGVFPTSDMAYEFVEKYLEDTRELHTYFVRQFICQREEFPEFMKQKRMIAYNIVLGQFEDMIYIRLADA